MSAPLKTKYSEVKAEQGLDIRNPGFHTDVPLMVCGFGHVSSSFSFLSNAVNNIHSADLTEDWKA